MKMVRKSMIALLSLTTALSVVGCGGNSAGGTTPSNSAEVTQEETKVETTEKTEETEVVEEEVEEVAEETYDFGGQVVKTYGGWFGNLESEDPE